MSLRFIRHILALCLVGTCISSCSSGPSSTPLLSQSPYLKQLDRIPLSIVRKDSSSEVFNVYLAKTEQEHYQGLSFTSPLTQKEGMLFVFSKGVVEPRFLMRDMNYPLDIRFYDKDGELVSEFTNLLPCEQNKPCPSVGPTNKIPIFYVLETMPQETITSITPKIQ